MTEQEARSRWCPFARVSNEHQSTHNRAGGDFVYTLSPSGDKLYRDALGNEGTITQLMRGKSPTDRPFEPIGTYTPAAPVAASLCLTSACMAWRKAKPSPEGEPSGYCLLMLHSVKP